MKRQTFRKLSLIISLLLFPVTIYYFSPYLIIMGATEGIISGSFVIFAAMLIGSVFFGRIFCGYLCPVGGLQECAFLIQDKKVNLGKKNYLKFIIWIIWIGIIAIFLIGSSHKIKIDFFYQTDHGISISNIYGYGIYYLVLFLMFVPPIIWGKRLACHCYCWMAPFMIIGVKIQKVLHLPGLHIHNEVSKCISCKKCDKNCPMSLPVSTMAKNEGFYHSECILCGSCIDTCPQKVLQYSIINKKKNQESEKKNGQ